MDYKSARAEDKKELEQIRLIQQLEEEDKQTIFQLVEKMLTHKKFKDFFAKNQLRYKTQKPPKSGGFFIIAHRLQIREIWGSGAFYKPLPLVISFLILFLKSSKLESKKYGGRVEKQNINSSIKNTTLSQQLSSYSS
ncbi:hypothetical protein [Chryseobacterium sp.]|uniref:hypothetical protein n=1 Tax=Chryseobacterium sp. TaxID=1871047 RepID=UPI0035C6DA13